MTKQDIIKALYCVAQNVDQKYEECNKHPENCEGCPFNTDAFDNDPYASYSEKIEEIVLAAARELESSL